MSTETERAWAAGFFDGEGSTGLATAPSRRTKNYLRMQLIQAGTDDAPPETLLRFQRAVGVGQIAIRRKRPTGKRLWEWRVQAFDEVMQAFEVMRPYLDLVKVDQFAAARAIRMEERELLADVAMMSRICRLCDHETWRGGGGLCSMHHQRIQKHGDPDKVLRKRVRSTSPVEVR